MSSQADALKKAVYEQQMIVNAFRSDVDHPERIDERIKNLRDQAHKLLDQAASLEARRQLLPLQLAEAEEKLRALRQSLQTTTTPDLRKLLKLVDQLKAAGVNVSEVINDAS